MMHKSFNSMGHEGEGMATSDDARFKRSESNLQAALLRLLQGKPLADIGVSELAREARMSRGTFYAHYENVADVYEQLVERMMGDVQTFDEHFACSSTAVGDCPAKPYCERIREAGDYAALTREPRFLATVLALGRAGAPETFEQRLVEEGIPVGTAQALMTFQMSGCHAVATSDAALRADWPLTRSMIDAFIEGGLEAVRNASARHARQRER